MHPFFIFRAPNTKKQLYIPRGKNSLRIIAWVKLPFTNTRDSDEIIVKEKIYLQDMLPILDETALELIDKAVNELYEHWATYLLNINETTSDTDIDSFYDNFPNLDYGFECYIRK
jgi:hypothetical protein